MIKTALYAGVPLVSRGVGLRRLGQSVAVKINSKAQGSKEFHRMQEDAGSNTNFRKTGKK